MIICSAQLTFFMVISASFGILSAGDEVINLAALSGILASLRVVRQVPESRLGVSSNCRYQSIDKVVETLPEKDLFRTRVRFSMSNFDISTPTPLFNVVTSVHGVYCNIEKGEMGCWLSAKKYAF